MYDLRSDVVVLIYSVPFAPPREAQVPWLIRFLSLLLRGVTPEQAFAQAGLRGPVEDRQARWLRGAFSSWHVDQPQVALPMGWFTRVDRSKQSEVLNTTLHYLIQPQSTRRVQAVLTPGPDRSGLERFRRRPLSIGMDVEPIPVIELDLGWADDPRNQEQVLFWGFKAQGRPSMVLRIVEEARRAQAKRDGHRALFWIRHETVCLHEEEALRHGLRQMTVEELRGYLSVLRTLAEELVRYDVRMLVHLSVQGAQEAELKPLACAERYFLTTILPGLHECVPEDELRKWLDMAGLVYSEEELREMVQRPYDELIDWLVHHYQLEAI
ncbi:MAG: hypothetical protein JNJ46_32415 [Myxococcales bacterium]|nr:hypothetical protein [Myxococcales bacterium]